MLTVAAEEVAANYKAFVESREYVVDLVDTVNVLQCEVHSTTLLEEEGDE